MGLADCTHVTRSSRHVPVLFAAVNSAAAAAVGVACVGPAYVLRFYWLLCAAADAHLIQSFSGFSRSPPEPCAGCLLAVLSYCSGACAPFVRCRLRARTRTCVCRAIVCLRGLLASLYLCAEP